MNLEQKYRIAFDFHTRGNLHEAERLYFELLAIEPDGFFPNHMLGLIRYQQGSLSEALKLIGTALRRNPNEPVALLNYAVALRAAGRFDDSLAHCDEAIKLKPDYAEAYHSRGDALRGLMRLDEALASYDRAISLKPGYADAHNNRGATLQLLNHFDEALASYNRAIELNPAYAEAYCNCGDLLKERNLLDEAVASYDKAIKLRPNYAHAYNGLGIALYGLERLQEALASYDKAIELRPDYATAYRNRGAALHGLRLFDQALASCDRAIELSPDHAEAYVNRSLALQDLRRYDEALESCNKAIELKPDYAESYVNRGNALRHLQRLEQALANYDKAIELAPDLAEAHCSRGVTLEALKRLDEAIASYDKAIEIKPDFAQAYYNKSIAELLLGRWTDGWKNHEWRKRKFEPFGNRTYSKPLLTRLEDARGKRVLVHWEQGLGDTIQFSRYVEMLRQAGAEVLFAPQEQLKRLLASLNSSVRMVDADGRSLSFDYHVPLMSLPFLFGTTLDDVPSKASYLFADEDVVKKWRDRLGSDGFKIGICWQGKPTYKQDVNRSFALGHFKPLSNLPGVRLISLHKGEGEKQLENLPEGLSVEVLGDDFDAGPDAFIDTAGVMKCLDLVITSDTSIAHLAGALGIPTWVALQHVPDWRWMLGRSDSPWYPTMRLLRQSSFGNWPAVFAEMESLLREQVRQGS